MGERKELSKTAVALASEEAMVVQTMGGRIHVRWDETARATPHGQLVFNARVPGDCRRVRPLGERLPVELQQP